MSPRMARFSLTAALLYFGPFLAGMTGASLAVVPIFAAVFLLWLAAMRPGVWAKATSQGTPAGLAAYLGGLTILQMLLLLVAFAVGRGLATLIGGVIALPLVLPVLLAVAALPLGRMVRDPCAEDPDDEEFFAETRSVWEAPEADAGKPLGGTGRAEGE